MQDYPSITDMQSEGSLALLRLRNSNGDTAAVFLDTHTELEQYTPPDLESNLVGTRTGAYVNLSRSIVSTRTGSMDSMSDK